MRKKVFGRKLSRNANTRKALFRSLARDMILKGKISTTRAKAKAIQPDMEKLMSLVKANSLDSRRRALSRLGNDKKAVEELFSKYAALTSSKSSGFTRIVNLPPRRGDNAQMARIEFVEK